VGAAVLLLLSACSSGEECRPAVLGRVDSAHACVLPAAEVAELQFCHTAGAIRTKGIAPICVSNAAGEQFAGSIATDEHIRGSGFVIVDNCPYDPLLNPDAGCPP
jgi:hypothetical protein